MSGGSLNYLQNHHAAEILADSQLMEALQDATKRLVAYGEEGQKARMATAAVFTQATEVRNTYQKLLDDIDELIAPLRNIWSMLDMEGTGDVSKEDVIVQLERYNKRLMPEEG